jgi:uncharacterized protein YndB with AHSA1/START domain
MSDTVTYPSPTDMHFSRFIAAPLTLVWRAHTEQGQLERWWGPEGFSISTLEMDVRPGGRWKFVMHGPGVSSDPSAPFGGQPTDYPNLIQYEEVVHQEKLVWSHGDFETVLFHVTTTFKAEGEGTRLETTMRLPSQAERDAKAVYAVPGHASTMGKLEAYLRQPHHELSFTRVLSAPVDKVWAAWTVREQLMPWFCPKPWQLTVCDIDLRPGGRFFTRMEGPHGESNELMSCYLVVEPQRRLIWTNALQPGYAPAAQPWCTCCVELQALSETETRLTARVMHADSATCEEHAKMGFPHGWHVALDQMLEMLVSNTI